MKKPFLYLFILSCIACSRSNVGGTADDNLGKAEELLETASELNGAEKYDSAIAVIRQALTMEGVADSTRGMLYAEMSASYNFKGDMRQAANYGIQAMNLCRGGIDAESFAVLSGNTGIAYRRMGMNDSAAIYYKQGVEEAAKAGDNASLSYLYNNLSVLYCEMERYAESTDFARKAQACADKAGDKTEYYSAKANEAINLVKQGKGAPAAPVLAEVYDKADSLGCTPLKLKTINYLLSAYRQTGDIRQTDKYLALGEALAKTFPPGSAAAAGIYEAKMSTQIERRDYRGALVTAERIEAIKGQTSMPRHKLLMNKALCMAALGNHAAAYLLEKQAAVMKDSVESADVKRQLSEYSMRFKTREKELEISRLEEERTAQRATLAAATAIAAVAVALLALVLTWVRHRRKITRKQTEIDKARRYIEGMENERTRLARELHDGACNELLAIGMQLHDDTTERSEAGRHISELRSELRRLSHELMPPSFKYADINEILQDYVTHVVKPDMLDIRYSASGGDWNGIAPDTAYQLYRITQEAVANVIRHAGATRAEVALHKGEDGLRLTISDNGQGGKTTVERGHGVKSMKDRAGAVGGEMTWKSRSDGTTVTVSVPPTDSRSF